MAAAIFEVFRATPLAASPSKSLRSADDYSSGSGRSLRDDTLGDELCRSVVAHMALLRNHMRLTIRALRRRHLVADEFAPLELLPARIVQQLATHNTLQDCVRDVILKAVSINGATDARSAQIIKDRLAALDVFTAELIDEGCVCSFTPLEQVFGIFSVGCCAEMAATFDYIAGDSPDVLALYASAKSLSFGAGRGSPVDYRRAYVPFLALLHHVDEFELVFDVKTVYMDLVAALKRMGHRGKDAWDDMVAAEIRIANGLKQAQSAARSKASRRLYPSLGQAQAAPEGHRHTARRSKHLG
jgi:hypothetical protein